MKIRSGILILSSLLYTVLSSCGTQIDTSEQTLVQLQNNLVTRQDISDKSNENLFEIVTISRKALFKEYDQNKDGFITKEELRGKIRDNFESIDLDKNGKITFKESTKSAFFFPLIMDHEFFRWIAGSPFHNGYDQDNNSLLSRDEFLSFYLRNVTDPKIIPYFKTVFTKNDLNKDDSLDLSEHEDAMCQILKKNDMKIKIYDNGYTFTNFIFYFNGPWHVEGQLSYGYNRGFIFQKP